MLYKMTTPLIWLSLMLPISSLAASWQSSNIDEQLILLSWGKQKFATVSPSIMVQNSQTKTHALSPIESEIKTSAILLQPSQTAQCIKLRDPQHSNSVLTELCITKQLNGRWTASLSTGRIKRAYGLGQEHDYDMEADGDWLGRSREPGDSDGNRMVYQNDGAVGNTQIPVLYLLGEGKENIALFFDHPKALSFDFYGSPIEIKGHGESVRIFVIGGKDLPSLRSKYLELTGRPPVPPKAAFGLWLSEYGFDNWQELDSKLQTLQQHRFPISGVVMDLQWFGGIKKASTNTPMGSLSWDKKKFPQHKEKIAALKQQGIGMMLIEEPYVGSGLAEYQKLQEQGALVLKCAPPCEPVHLNHNPWWGKGGMLDFTNSSGADFWHDYRRESLIEDGIVGHWTDLGEPEAYKGTAWYHGVEIDGRIEHKHKSINNLYNLLWSRSIYQGYERNNRKQRPFILSRSGTAGSQRYGVALWSGDIGVSLDNLLGQFNVQSHMSLSGIDYFGSDVGGFHGFSWDEQYTQWLAASLFTDIPVRPHTQNLCNCKETSPALMGDFFSNFYNLKLRYALTPYYYTAAHLAWREGQAVVAPLVYRYQQDEQARHTGRMKLIGQDLLVALEASDGKESTAVYLPQGEWYDYRFKKMLHSQGDWQEAPLYLNGLYRLPLYIKSGAIIPLQTKSNTLQLLVVLNKDGAKGQLIEDDGTSIAYQHGALRETQFKIRRSAQKLSFTIAAQGEYKNALEQRAYQIEIVNLKAKVNSIELNGQSIEEWQQDGQLLQVKLPTLAVNQAAELTILLH